MRIPYPSGRCAALLFAAAAAAPANAQPYHPFETAPDRVSIEKNIPYDRYPETVLDIMRPRAQRPRIRPGVMMVHGGGWARQAKERVEAGYCLPFLQHGFVVANVEYRLAKAAPAPAAVLDVMKAGEWFWRNAGRYGVDPKRIVVIGESAGAHLALMAGMPPRSAGLGRAAPFAAIVDVFGIADVAALLSASDPPWWAREWIPEQPGRLDLARRVSPLTYVRGGLPPVLIVHGDTDDTVPYQQSVTLLGLLRKVRVDAELITVPGGKHGFTEAEWERIVPRMFAFLEQRGIAAPAGP
jgi:acetyl esterase/lipase